MDPYLLGLFLHLSTVIAAFVASSLMHAALGRLRRAEDVAAAREALGTMARLGPKMPLFMLALIITGGWLTQQRWSFRLPWVAVAIVGLLAMLAISGAVLKPRSQAIGARLDQADGMLDAELTAAVRDPSLLAWSHAPMLIASGIMFTMVFKPGWVGSAGAIAVALAAGLVPVALGRRAPASQAA